MGSVFYYIPTHIYYICKSFISRIYINGKATSLTAYTRRQYLSIPIKVNISGIFLLGHRPVFQKLAQTYKPNVCKVASQALVQRPEPVNAQTHLRETCGSLEPTNSPSRREQCPLGRCNTPSKMFCLRGIFMTPGLGRPPGVLRSSLFC